MSADCLVLDHNYRPVSVMNWMDVMTLYCKDRVVVVESDPNKILRSQHFEMNMPVVVRLKNEFARRQRKEVPFSRRNVAIRDKSTCQYCGLVLTTQEYTYDHVRPRSKGGVSKWTNLVLCCLECNKKKADHLCEEVKMWPRTEPVKPSANDPRFTFKLRVYKMKPQWKNWSAWLYWNAELEK